MSDKPRPLIAGNWKMNGLRADAIALVGELNRRLAERPQRDFELLVCPPATLLSTVAPIAANGLLVGGQDCHGAATGAFTGDISAEMLRDAGASYVIVGHSERRQGHSETDAAVEAKARAAWRAGLVAIVCIGETLAERESGATLAVLERQILNSVPRQGGGAANLVVAYEPVWAIGTGRTPSVGDVAAAHGHIRKVLGLRTTEAGRVRLLYGGSVKPDNAASLLAAADVDGALVGGASLKAADFWAIATALA